MAEVKQALKLDDCHVSSLHLLVLLLSAEKKVCNYYNCIHSICRLYSSTKKQMMCVK